MPYITVGQENSANIDLYYEDLGTGNRCTDSWISIEWTFLGEAGLGSAKRRVSVLPTIAEDLATQSTLIWL